MSAEFEKHKKDISVLQKDKKELVHKVDDMQIIIKKQDAKLTDAMNGLEYLLNKEKRCNAEIKGIQEQSNEDLIKHVNKMAIKAGVDAKAQVYTEIKRVKNKSVFGSSIIVKFQSEEQRNEFITKCRKAKLNTAVISGGTNLPIYVNEEISWITRKTLASALTYKKQNAFAFCWVKNGRVFLRKSNGSQAFLIRNESDLDTI